MLPPIQGAKLYLDISHSSRNAIWHEKLLVDLEKGEVQQGVGLFLSIIDCNTKKYMGKCIVPVDTSFLGSSMITWVKIW